MGLAVDARDRIGRRMKLQDLHVLMSVIEAGSMGKAALRLNITQPAISRSIAELEHAFGVRLLDRHRQGVEPTEYGRALLDGGVAVFNELRQTVRSIETLADPEVGEVRIGSGYHLAPSFASTVIVQLSGQYPRMAFHLVSPETTVQANRELLGRNVDLLIGRGLGAAADRRLDFEFLFDDPYFVVAGVEHPWARRRRIEPYELVNATWVLPPPTTSPGASAMEAFRASGLEYPRVTVSAVLPAVRMSLLATGRFLTISSSSALHFPTRRHEFKVLPVNLPLPSVPVGIVTLKNRTLSPAARLFIEHAREVAKPLARRN